MTDYPEMPSSEQEWRAHWAIYQVAIKQRDAAWREVEHLRAGLAAAPGPEVVGYVVLHKRGDALALWDENLYPSPSATTALLRYCHSTAFPEAHVGVVTALPDGRL